MHVVKRNGSTEEVSFDKIYNRIKYMVAEQRKLDNINPHNIAQRVIQSLYDGVSTTEIDITTAKTCVNLCIENIEYGILAGRITINNHHKNTLTGFKDKMERLYLNKDRAGNMCSIISTLFYKFVKKNQKQIESAIDYNRDYLIDYFGFKVLERSYLLKIVNTDTIEIIERPQDLFMRVAIFIHMGHQKDWKTPSVMTNIIETYDLISTKYFTHATPTLFNAGLTTPGLASCFLMGVEDDLGKIFKAITDCAHISKWSGGIGIHISNIRGRGSLIKGTGGNGLGTIPFLKVFEATSVAVNQGSKRKGSFAIYLEPHHSDVMEFLLLRRQNGEESSRAPNLFLALWVSDLFMERVEKHEMWSLFCPNTCPGLSDVYGDEYRALYTKYEREGLATKKILARDVWNAIFESQKESGMPYILFKDAVNRNSNQSNLGVIKSSNLCSEIVEYSSSTEYAVCTLASICLSQFVEENNEYSEFPQHPSFNYDKFQKVIQVIVRNLNKVIDINYYPVQETRHHLRHRPLGIGVQGLIDVFYKFKICIDSNEAKQLNKYIFETLYYTAVSESSKLSRDLYMKYKHECIEHGSVSIQIPTKKDGKLVMHKIEYTDPNDIPTTIGSHSSFLENGGTPLSRGIFHWEMCGLKEDDLLSSFDWGSLREHVVRFGTRNSMFIALMPTAGTSTIMGNIECFEPLASNVFIRTTLSGEHIVVNKYLMNDLNMMGIWNKSMENWIKRNNGSIQSINGLPDNMKRQYRTVWEMSQKSLIDLAADRQPFVDQSQSLNLFVQDLSLSNFSSMHMYSWKKGLKTGCYYLRSCAATTAQTFTVDDSLITDIDVEEVEYNPPEIIGPNEECLVCGS